MNATIRKLLTSNIFSRWAYGKALRAYKFHWAAKGARRYFLNFDDFKKAFKTPAGATALVDLRTIDGLTLTIGQCYSDAVTVADILLREPYTRHLALPANPVVIDVGGFVGDFALYAVKRLNASRVITCEPSPRNWALLLKNIAINGCEDRIEPVNKAVTNGGNVMLNLDIPNQAMVSAYYPSTGPFTAIPGISLSRLLRDCNVESVDLLKIDCEGGEYSIIESTASAVYRRIRNVVFEYHEIDGSRYKLESAKQRLRNEGYILHNGPHLVSASRP